MNNTQIAEMFENVADLMEVKGDSIHRILSYRRASETIRAQPRDLKAIAEEGTLTDIQGIGKAISDKINEMLDTGKLG